MSDLKTQRNNVAQSQRAWLKHRNPFKSSGRNNLPNLDDAFKVNRSIKAPQPALDKQGISDLCATNAESEVSRQDDLSNKSLLSLSSSFTASSPNVSVLSIGCQIAATEPRRQIFENFGFDASFSQSPSSISHPSNEVWALNLEQNVSAVNSFFEGKSDVSAIRSGYEPSIFDSSQVAIDQSTSDFFEDLDRLKSLATPEKNRHKFEEASRLQPLRKHIPTTSKYDYDDEGDFECSSRGFSRFEADENLNLDGEKDSLSLGSNGLGSRNEKYSPVVSEIDCKNYFSKIKFAPTVIAEKDLSKASRRGDEETFLAECAVKEILGLRQEWPVGGDDFSKLTIDEASEVQYVNIIDSSEYSRDKFISPSGGSGFFSEEHRATRKLGLFKISPIASEKGEEMQCNHRQNLIQYKCYESPLASCSTGEFVPSHFGENYLDEHVSDYLLSYVCADLPDSPTEQKPTHASPDKRRFVQPKKTASFDEHDEIVKDLTPYLSRTILDSPTKERHILSPRKKLFALQSRTLSENLEGFSLRLNSSNNASTTNDKLLIDTSCISFAESEFSTDLSFSSNTCYYGDDHNKIKNDEKSLLNRLVQVTCFLSIQKDS